MTDQFSVDVALALFRVVLGVVMTAHGWNHAFGPGGISGTARWFASIGLRPARIHALLSAWGEMLAGVLLLVGFLMPFAGAFVIGSMLTAWWAHHRGRGFFIFREGAEYVLVLGTAAFLLSVVGGGAWSLEEYLGWADDLHGLTGGLIALAGLVGGVVLLATCWRPISTAESTAAAEQLSQRAEETA